MAHDGGEDGLAGLALAFHKRTLCVSSGGLNDELEVGVAVGVGWVDGACSVGR